MENREKFLDQWKYQLDIWRNTTGFDPIGHVATVDVGEAYEMNTLHVFKNKRGYAVVHESGCSCYETRDADISLYPSMKAVKESLRANGNAGKAMLDELTKMRTDASGE